MPGLVNMPAWFLFTCVHEYKGTNVFPGKFLLLYRNIFKALLCPVRVEELKTDFLTFTSIELGTHKPRTWKRKMQKTKDKISLPQSSSTPFPDPFLLS
jgi:hypothetical protein